MQGGEGLQVLEAAFIKQKFGSVDRLAAEDGWGEDVLLSLGGDNFLKYRIDSTVWNSKKEKWEYPGLSSLDDDEKNTNCSDFLENFDPEMYIATASTKHSAVGILGSYTAKGTTKFFVPGHAYSISKVNLESKTVVLANPWNTSKHIELTFNQFKEVFSIIGAIRINNRQLLENMRTVKEGAV